MKKTLIALLALGSVAMGFNDVEWTFDNTLVVSGTVPGAELVPTVKSRTGNNDTVINPTYVATDMQEGTKVGDYYLTQDLGSALQLAANERLTIGGNTYWSNGDASLMVGPSATHSFTLTTWVNMSSVSGENMIFGSGSNTGAGISLAVVDGKLDLLAKGQKHYYFSTSELVSANTWTNLTITYDVDSGIATGYINGKSIGSITLSGAAFASAGGSGIEFGSGCFDIQQGNFTGSIADFKILSGALSGDDLMSAAFLTATAPVPEPATGALSVLALTGLAARRRRK